MPSPVWQHFDKLVEKDGVKVKCKMCQRVMKFLNNTTNMIQHLKGLHNVELNILPAKGGKHKRTFESSVNSSESVVDDPSPSDQSTEEIIEVSRPKHCGPFHAYVTSAFASLITV